MVSDAVQKAMQLSCISELNPVQRKAIDAGLFGDRNMVIAAPTASGKTLIAEMKALDVIRKNKKVVYIVPLKALASEKFEEFRKKYGPLGIRVAISIGDLDSSDPWLAGYDLIVATSEKLDSLIRHGAPWIEMVGLVVADEIHLLDSPERGPTLEVVLTRLRQIANPAILALSATISNYEELSEWLNAVPIKSDYRPVKLFTGIYFDGAVTFVPKRILKVDSKDRPLIDIIEKTVQKGKQALVFVSTRRGTESAAEKIGDHIRALIPEEERRGLSELSERIGASLEHSTKQCSRLARAVKNGAAFHHAGLASRQRHLIEGAFRDGTLKVITATPTLSFGLNLPAYRVLIRDLKRFSSFRGWDYIPILEIQQMMGRSGRPSFDTEGEAILMTKTEPEAKYAWENYINGEPEKIYSKLGVEPVLRMHVLSLIASETTPDKKSLMDFFSKTFYAHQYSDMTELENILERVLALLQRFNFIAVSGRDKSGSDNPFKRASELSTEDNAQLRPTRIGKRVSELYIDPLTADSMIRMMSYGENNKQTGPNQFAFMQMISNTIEMRPLLSMRRGDDELIEGLIAENENELMEKPPNPWDIEYDSFMRSIKTAALFKMWADEAGEDAIFEQLKVAPGELHARLNNADWLLYSAQELALLLSFRNIMKELRRTRLRIKYGVREELLPLVRLKGIGRVKARRLFNSGLRRLSDLREVPIAKLEQVIGSKTAQQIKEQLGDNAQIA